MYRRWSLAPLALIGSMLIAGCSGGGGGGDDGHTLGGSVTGLSGGTLVLAAGSQTLDVTANGRFEFGERFDDGEQVTLAVRTQPAGQRCTVTSATDLTLTADIDNATVSCGSTVGRLSGTVIDYQSGRALSGATVSLSRVDAGGTTVLGATTTDSQGRYTFRSTGIAERFVLSAKAAGYGADAISTSNTTASPNRSVDALELPAAQTTATLDPTRSSTVAVGGATVVTLPANALVTSGGQAPSGNVTATVTVMDPSADTSVMPGALETLASGGTVRPIESWGALDVRFAAADGAALNLASGATATVSIPLASARSSGTSPATVPLYYFDEAAGYWVQEGSASLTEVDGAWFYVGTVSHFTTWNADQVYSTVRVRGCVQDSDGQRLSGVTITADGRDYLGSASTTTDADGNFSVSARQSSSVLLVAVQAGQSRTVSVTTTTVNTTLDGCLVLTPSAASIRLTWGANPRDLDSHFFAPNADGGESEVDYTTKVVTDGDAVYALDVDDTTSFGPEVVTATAFARPGTYRYGVKLYAGSSTIAASPARVELTLGGATTIFSPADAQGDSTLTWWHVFNLVVAADGSVTVQPVQRFADSGDPPSAQSTGAVAKRVRIAEPMKRHAP